jgi:hypothetical protein
MLKVRRKPIEYYSMEPRYRNPVGGLIFAHGDLVLLAKFGLVSTKLGNVQRGKFGEAVLIGER